MTGWTSVDDRLPPNADKPNAFCPRYLVYTDYGITEGWYNPDSGCWYGLLWTLLVDRGLDDSNIDIERGDIPVRVKNLPVKYWREFPKPPIEGGE
jgi:hypothetical protein